MRLIIADDHALFRDALTQYISRAEPDAKLELAADLHGVMEMLLEDKAVDLIMLDLRMPGMNGLQGLQKLRDSYPDIPVVLLSGLAEDADVRQAMSMGAAGYFPKTMPGKMMLQGIYKVLQGESYIPVDHNTDKMMPSYFSDQKKPAAPPTLSAPLTQREKEVLSYLSRGVPNKEIADKLGLQVVTVKLHVRGICRKLGVKNRTQAALMAQKVL